MFLVNSCMGSLAAAPSQYLQIVIYVTRVQLSRKNLNINVNCFLSQEKTGKPHIFINIVTGQTLSRSYGRLFAEFLDEESLVHLGLLDLSTCVGLRYGRLSLLI